MSPATLASRVSCAARDANRERRARFVAAEPQHEQSKASDSRSLPLSRRCCVSGDVSFDPASDEAPVAEPTEPAEPPAEMAEPEAEPASVEEPTMNEAAPTASTNAEQAAAAAEAAAASTPPNQPIARPIARRGLGGSSGGGGGGRARRLAFGTPDAAANGQQGAVRRAAQASAATTDGTAGAGTAITKEAG